MFIKIVFPYTIRKGVFTPKPLTLIVDASKVSVRGYKTGNVRNYHDHRNCKVTAFYISYKGIEYGTFDMTPEQYADMVNQADEVNGLFGDEFDDMFQDATQPIS